MTKVAKLVYYSFATRVVVDESSTEDDIIRASKRKILEKAQTELGENLEEIIDDEECPVGTFETDLPSIDRVILNVQEQQYIVMGKGLPIQVRKFDSFSDWDSVENLDGEPVFDVQIDDDNQTIDGKLVGDAKHPYTFQYVNLIWREDQDNWEVGLDYKGVEPEIVTESIAEILAKMLSKNLVK